MLLVVLYHCKGAVSGGYVGVDVFFVISGFLITTQLARELVTAGKVSLLRFYARRARRILPAATVVTVTTVIVSGMVLFPLAARRVFDDARAAAVFSANTHFASAAADYFNSDLPLSPMQHYWSLSVEEQFYFVWPLLLIVSSLVWLTVLRRSQRRRPPAAPRLKIVIVALAAVATASFIACLLDTSRSPIWAYYSILTRAWELSAGALVALSLPLIARMDRRLAAPLTWLGIACILTAAVSFNQFTPFPGCAALLPVAGAVAVIGAGSAATGRWGAEALLGTAPFAGSAAGPTPGTCGIGLC